MISRAKNYLPCAASSPACPVAATAVSATIAAFGRLSLHGEASMVLRPPLKHPLPAMCHPIRHRPLPAPSAHEVLDLLMRNLIQKHAVVRGLEPSLQRWLLLLDCAREVS